MRQSGPSRRRAAPGVHLRWRQPRGAAAARSRAHFQGSGGRAVRAVRRRWCWGDAWVGERVRAIRGATTVQGNTAEAILAATRQLLMAMQAANGFSAADLVSAILTATPDLDAAFPAAAARQIGWDRVPLLDAVEIAVPGALARCVRVLLHVYTERDSAALHHVYAGDAACLRPDLR